MSILEQRKNIWCFIHDIKKKVVYEKIKKKENNIFKKKVCVECLKEFENKKKPIPKPLVIRNE